MNPEFNAKTPGRKAAEQQLPSPPRPCASAPPRYLPREVNAKSQGRKAAEQQLPSPPRPCASAPPRYLPPEKNAKSPGRQDAEGINAIAGTIVRCAIEVHRTLGGPGLLESVYEEALAWELAQAGMDVKRQTSLPIPYKGHVLATPLRIDLIVESSVIVECKAVTAYNEVFAAQALTYLRLSGLSLGLVINFGERLVKNGIHRVVNGL